MDQDSETVSTYKAYYLREKKCYNFVVLHRISTRFSTFNSSKSHLYRRVIVEKSSRHRFAHIDAELWENSSTDEFWSVDWHCAKAEYNIYRLWMWTKRYIGGIEAILHLSSDFVAFMVSILSSDDISGVVIACSVNKSVPELSCIADLSIYHSRKKRIGWDRL